VQLLCKRCRKSNDVTQQTSLKTFFPGLHVASAPPKASVDEWEADQGSEADEHVEDGGVKAVVREHEGNSGSEQTTEQATEATDEATELVDSEKRSKDEEEEEDILTCSQCLRPLQEKPRDAGSKPLTVCPYIHRLRGYQRVAKDAGEVFMLTDAEAVAIMRLPCSMCGTEEKELGNGITRLRVVVAEGVKGMGPYSVANTAPACKRCNLMKGYHMAPSLINVCRHIATHKGLGNFGQYPEHFVNNTSKRNRSSYLTDSKTFSMTNDFFQELVRRPCYFCGKASDPPRHYNGLDRLDSTVRVYMKGTCVSCCGTCNVAKWRFTETEFVAQCLRVAQFNPL
jgi:hypothetical protein